MALFITFEGGEGSGKSTQARALYTIVSAVGVPVVLTYEPGGTSLGQEVRHLLKRSGKAEDSTRRTEISSLAELFLFNASRAQLLTEVIRPSLERGSMVICDRYTHSTVAYQGYGRGLDFDSVQAVNDIATQGLVPDLIILLDIPVETGLKRKGPVTNDRFEMEELAFHQRVRDGYHKMAAAEPDRWLVVDASLPQQKIEQKIWQRVSKLL